MNIKIKKPLVEFHDFSKACKKCKKKYGTPTHEELNSVKVGQSIKVGNEYESFWVMVVVLLEGEFIGYVNNHLKRTQYHGLRYKDLIKVHFNNVKTLQVPEKRLLN